MALSKIGQYEIRREIGRGGFATVYEGYDPSVDRRVAIKVLHTGDDPALLERFRHEAKAAGSLHHKNIVTTYAFGEQKGSAYIAMEYLEGEDLQQIIRASPGPSLLEKVRIMREVAEGLQYAHSKGVVHRDIKPSNIKVVPDGQVKIMDFGIARMLRENNASRLTQTGALIGTIPYMAPEQFRGLDLGPLGDIFAYGIVYYELLTGKNPFAAQDMGAVVRNVIQTEPERLSAIVPDCPPGLEAVIQRALNKNPELRYQTMDDLLVDSEPLLRDLRKNRATELLNDAQTSLREGNPESARSILRQALELDPGSPDLRLLWDGIQAQQRGIVRTGPDSEQPWDPPGAAPPPNVPQVPRSNAGEFTRLFKTTPVTPARGSPPPSSDSGPVPSDDAPGEFTRVFRTAPLAAAPVSAAPPSADREVLASDATGFFIVPAHEETSPRSLPEDNQPPADTILTISQTADVAFVGTKITLEHFPFTIGRLDTDWKLTFDGAVSARHAELDYRDGGFFIRDLGSANGTFVNGQRLRPMRYEVLLFGAHILLGSNTELVFGSGTLQELPDLRGRSVGNGFTLIEKLHSSSKSVLYLARDEKFERQAVVKLLSPSLMRHSGYSEQFAREAKTARGLHHSRICQILDYGELRLEPSAKGRSAFVCMEYLPGGSLQSRLNQGQAFPLEQVASWLESLCEVLEYIHGRGVVHAGIKPSAVVFDADGNPYLTDFALASKPGEGVRTSVIGAPAFLAPEQWDGADPTPATDQYSLGVLFYWLATGALPFEGQEHSVVRHRNLLRGAMPADEMAAQNGRAMVPSDVSAVFKRALALNPSERFATARDFAAAFRSALAPHAELPAKTPSVFISYRRVASSLLAFTLKREMERDHGFLVFVDAIQQDSTGQFPLKLKRKIEQCDVFVCLLADSTLDSDWVQREIQLAYESRKPMIPVFQESYRNPANMNALNPSVQELLTFEGVKVLDQQNLYVEAAIQTLIASARQSVGTSGPQPVFSAVPEAPSGAKLTPLRTNLAQRLTNQLLALLRNLIGRN